MMNAIGIEAGWRQIQGTPAFFACTKKMYNALQGDRLAFSEEEKAIYEQVILENATRFHLTDCDAIAIHDPQPLPMIGHFPERSMPWLWQCHIDLSAPDAAAWNYLRGFVDRYDAAIFSLPDYAQDLDIVQRFVTPAINPFSAKNGEMAESEIDDCLSQYRIPTDRPLVTQISRFDRWKDPMGVIEAFRRVRQSVDCTLVLVGNSATDDPEGDVMLETIKSSIDERVVVVTADDPVLVNALQRRAAVVLQKSTREGVGLTVTEAMWKGAAVIGGNVGGIRHQIRDGDNGFLVDTIDQAADRIVQLLCAPTVRQKFLMSRLLEDWLDLLAGYRRS
jgi:trehalose synthase